MSASDGMSPELVSGKCLQSVSGPVQVKKEIEDLRRAAAVSTLTSLDRGLFDLKLLESEASWSSVSSDC